MLKKLLAILLVLEGLNLCIPVGAKVIFDGAPDPSRVYPGNQPFPNAGAPSDIAPAIEADEQPFRSFQSNVPAPETPSSKVSPLDASVAWINWHARIDKEIAKRFASFSGDKRFYPAHVEMKYAVSKDREIKNVRFDQKSSSVLFNTMARVVVNSLNKDSILEFPDGYDESDVEMKADFSARSKL